MRPTLFTSLFLVCIMVSAQDRSKGPWWPNANWGIADQTGASNWIGPQKILQAMALAKTGEVVELGHLYERGMPNVGQRSFSYN